MKAQMIIEFVDKVTPEILIVYSLKQISNCGKEL